MTDKLSKLPIKPVLYLVFISGISIIALEYLGIGPGGALSIAVRTVFWCSAIAYFSLRAYQIMTRNKAAARETESDSAEGEN